MPHRIPVDIPWLARQGCAVEFLAFGAADADNMGSHPNVIAAAHEVALVPTLWAGVDRCGSHRVKRPGCEKHV
jgi:hypothetical protein